MKNNILAIKAEIFDALAHPLRLKILAKLRDGPCCVCKIMPYVEAEQSNVSHHLAILKQAGVVNCEKKGMEVWYEITDNRIFEIIDLVNEFITKHLKKQQSILKNLIKERK